MHILEKHGLGTFKNLVLPKFWVFLAQAPSIADGSLLAKIDVIVGVLLKHCSECELCKRDPQVCQVCFNSKGPKFFDFEISKAQRCAHCKILAHLDCLRTRHSCSNDGRQLKF